MNMRLLALRSLHFRDRALVTSRTPYHVAKLLALPNGVLGVVMTFWQPIPPKVRPPVKAKMTETFLDDALDDDPRGRTRSGGELASASF